MKFELACATVDPQTDSFDPSPLVPYVQSLGVTYHYLSEPIVELAKSKLQVNINKFVFYDFNNICLCRATLYVPFALDLSEGFCTLVVVISSIIN